ncbi:unnamed protein product [Boreogadus saida]
MIRVTEDVSTAQSGEGRRGVREDDGRGDGRGGEGEYERGSTAPNTESLQTDWRNVIGHIGEGQERQQKSETCDEM